MGPLRKVLDLLHLPFKEGGKLERFYPAYEAVDTFLYSPGTVTRGPSHVRDALDLKRTMILVVVALVPCCFMALFNTGLQANQALGALASADAEAAIAASGWRGLFIAWLGVGYDPGSLLANLVHGAAYFLPVYIVCMAVGGTWEAIFSLVRKHEINEGFLVTGLLFPLTLPPTIPLWQVAVGISFGVVIGKEVFGGTGKNFLNPALTARAFLYFAYPLNMTGDAIWTAVDGFTGATPLGVVATEGMEAVRAQVTFGQAFLGTMPGSMGETSVLACLLGVVVLVGSGIGSWRIMLSMTLGALAFCGILWGLGSTTNPRFEMDPLWHLVVGGFAFGAVFMATDPVSAAMTNGGKWVYGALIGVMTLLIRVVNPAFPEGVMLAILFGNVFAPVIDHYVIKANIKRRLLRTHV